MTVTYDIPKSCGPSAWLFSWSSDIPNPTFHLFRNGIDQGFTKGFSWFVASAHGELVTIEVFDDATSIPGVRTVSARVLIAWDASAGADRYRIEELIAAAWVPRTVIRDNGDTRYTWPTAPLDDGPGYQFRVVPIGADDNEGAPVVTAFEVIRPPDPPVGAFTYDSGTGLLTVSLGS